MLRLTRNPMHLVDLINFSSIRKVHLQPILCLQSDKVQRGIFKSPKLVFNLKNTRFQSTSEISIKENFVTRVKARVSNLISSPSKIKIGAPLVYEKIGDDIDYTEFMTHFKLPDTFNSWFLCMQLHVWICVAVGSAEENGRIFRNKLVEFMWLDVEERIKALKTVTGKERKKYLGDMSEQFQAALVSYDEGMFGDDTVLAASVWRTLFNFGPVDPRLLEDAVHYIRKQMSHIESLNMDEMFYSGKVSFLPLRGIGGVSPLDKR